MNDALNDVCPRCRQPVHVTTTPDTEVHFSCPNCISEGTLLKAPGVTAVRARRLAREPALHPQIPAANGPDQHRVEDVANDRPSPRPSPYGVSPAAPEVEMTICRDCGGVAYECLTISEPVRCASCTKAELERMKRELLHQTETPVPAARLQ